MFVDNGDGTYTVRFYGGSYGAYYNADGSIGEGFANGTGIADYVTVDRMLPSTSSGVFAYSNYGASLTNPNNVLWIALAEKAYAHVECNRQIQSNPSQHLRQHRRRMDELRECSSPWLQLNTLRSFQRS